MLQQRQRVHFIPMVLALLLFVLCGPWSFALATAATPKTTVSLTFDDALASQTQAQTTLDKYGMKGTFYLISGDIGTSGHLTLAQAKALQTDGQDIGGHTIIHPDLPTLTAAQQQQEICNGRSQLAGDGLTANTFAYPFGDYTSTTEQIVKNCGFSGARGVGGIDCAGCDPAESIPPADPYAIQTPDSIQSNTSLSSMESYVTKAEKKGGWVVLVVHDICSSNCDTYSISPTNLNSFLSWLHGQSAVNVKTMTQVMGKGTPATLPPPPPTTIQNPSLEADTAGAVVPDCWQEGGFGTNAPTWARTSVAHTGSWAEQLQLTSITDGDAKLVTQQHDPSCEPVGTPGHTYTLGAWYKSTQPVYLVAYYLDSTGTWQFWDQSNSLPASSAYTQATWTTPTLPAGATRLSVGLSLRSVGSVTMDDFSLKQN